MKHSIALGDESEKTGGREACEDGAGVRCDLGRRTGAYIRCTWWVFYRLDCQLSPRVRRPHATAYPAARCCVKTCWCWKVQEGEESVLGSGCCAASAAACW